MGAGIAEVIARNGYDVVGVELTDAALERGREHLQHSTGRAVARGKLSEDEQKELLNRITFTSSINDVKDCQLVIEAIVEKLEVKQNLFKSLEGKLKPGAVLATNTSSIMIEKIAEPLADPGRLIGIHFFNPVAQMPLVEVIKGQSSRDEEVGKGCAFVAAIDKFPLIVRSSPGFLVNRVLGPYMMAALQRVERGEPKEKIDEAARAFGMPMGPVELADTVGLDVCASVGKILNPDQGPTKLDQMVAAGKLGKKSGEGFYKWSSDGKRQ